MPAAGNPPSQTLTRTTSDFWFLALLTGALWIGGCGPRKQAIVSSDGQREARAAIADFRLWALEPSGLGPLAIDPGPQVADAPGVSGTARVVRPEEAAWNQWGPDARPLLFNDRVALLVEVDLKAEGELRWLPDQTTLEVNRPEDRLVAVPSAEHVLAELQWHALQQEKQLLDGDLVQRTRHAGGFREAFVRVEGERMQGLLAFPREGSQQAVGALRLTVALRLDGAPAELEWVFQ